MIHFLPDGRVDRTDWLDSGQVARYSDCWGTQRFIHTAPEVWVMLPAALELTDALDRATAALRDIYEWYDRDGSVGGASVVFEENRAALAEIERNKP